MELGQGLAGTVDDKVQVGMCERKRNHVEEVTVGRKRGCQVGI